MPVLVEVPVDAPLDGKRDQSAYASSRLTGQREPKATRPSQPDHQRVDGVGDR